VFGNPHAIHEVPLYDLEVRVWCAMCVYKICGLAFFKETISFDLQSGNLNIILQRIAEEKET
jgi:hypothetical protein